MESDTGTHLDEIRVDGGMVGNDLLMQFQADIMGVDVVVPAITETTVLGAAFGSGLAAGVWADTDDLVQHWSEDRRFRPHMTDERRDALSHGWQKAIERSLGWAEA